MRYLPVWTMWLALFFFIAVATAADHTFEVVFSYAPPTDKIVTEYQLYQDGNLICTSLMADITTAPEGLVLDCAFTSAPGRHDYTLVAAHDDGSFSDHSPPYSFRIGGSWQQFKARGLFHVRARVYLPEPE